MQEKLITFNTAKLAKEKGFDEYTEGFYYPSAYGERLLFEDGIEVNTTYYDSYPEGTTLLKCKYNTEHKTSLTQDNFIAAPTQSLLQKFIRETRGVHIEIHRNASGYYWSMCKADGGTDLGWSDISGPNDGGVWNSFEDALENALQVQLFYDLPFEITFRHKIKKS